MVVQKSKKIEAVSETETRKRRKQSTEGVTSTLYNAIQEPLTNVRLDAMLVPSMVNMSSIPQFHQLWAPVPNQPKYVSSTFGDVPFGSLLSYQLNKATTASSSMNVLNLADVLTPPSFTCPNLETHIQAPLDFQSSCIYDSLEVDHQQSTEFEAETRCQGESGKWHELRRHRITASKFKRVCSRRGNFEKLAKDLLSTKTVQTKQMKYGLEHEPVAAKTYADLFGRNIYVVGFVVNPSAFYLGCTPDRRVYDPDADQCYGLLEIKCPSVEYVSQCSYLKRPGSSPRLKSTHDYYYQVMGQMGLTGTSWCDFFVKARNDYHCERILYNDDFFTQMKEKLDFFYFCYFLPALADNN